MRVSEHGQQLTTLTERERTFLDSLPAGERPAALAGLRALAQRRANDAAERRVLGLEPARLPLTRPAAQSEPEPEPVSVTPAPAETPAPAAPAFITHLGLSAALVKRHLADVALAYDLWKAYTRQQRGAGEVLRRGQVIEVLRTAGMSRRSAERALARGVGLCWDAHTDRSDRRARWYTLWNPRRAAAALALPGGALRDRARLPAIAYRHTAATYAAHVVGAWLQAHPRSSRAEQAEAFGRTERQIRHMQRAAGQPQQTVICHAGAPRSDTEGLELTERLTTKQGEPNPAWRVRDRVYWQSTNHYPAGPARLLRRRSAKSERPVSPVCTSPDMARGATTDWGRRPRHFQELQHAVRWQQRHAGRGAYVYQADLARNGPARSAQREKGTSLLLAYRYSRAALWGIPCI